MALNSNIHNIPLLGNCDLTNFKTEIHDYEGFEQDNSFFLNKRKVNWWKRNVSGGEIGGGLSGQVNGDYFDVYKNNAFIGKISRQYYKLETVSADAWRSESLQKVVNPFPGQTQRHFLYKYDNYFTLSGNAFDYTVRRIGNCLCVYDYKTRYFSIYLNGERRYFNGPLLVGYNDNYSAPNHVDFYYAESEFIHNFHGGQFTIPAGYVFVCARNGNKSQGFAISLSDFSFISTMVRVDEDCYWEDHRSNYSADGIINCPGYRGERGTNAYSVTVVNGELYFSEFVKEPQPLIINRHFYVYNGNTIVYSESLSGDTHVLTPDLIKRDSNYPCTIEMKCGIDNITKFVKNFRAQNVYEVFNYSKKFGKWAVNFINNTAVNIAHNYKKLFALEGNEDNGTVTDIDGYNDTYIYFHYGTSYYRISIATADIFAETVQSLNNIYYIFNTTSYLNAFYSNGNDWFCSCDDWNDRVIWSTDFTDCHDVFVTSRLNNNWQTKTDVVSVSGQLLPNIVWFPVRPVTNTMQAYQSSATWNGSRIVYDAGGNVVDTSAWQVGHSLNGYYYALSYTSQPGRVSPIWIDAGYTCPVYLDQNLISRAQRYNVYFPVNPPENIGSSSLCKQGYLTSGGFTVELDEGDMYTIPETSFYAQMTSALCDTQFLVYPSSVLIINKGGAYTGLISSRLGGMWTLIYLNQTELDPLGQNDAVFVVNGVQYSYRAESNRILDVNGAYVCNTNLMKYIGFSTHCAYFYSQWDKNIYLFEGDNTLKKFVPLERFTPAFSVYQGKSRIDTLNIASLDVVIVNLDTAAIILFANQWVLLETGKINFWSINENQGTFIINGVMYSLIKSALNYGNADENEIEPIPIKIETQFYGIPGSETNMINDCVYLNVDNLMSINSGKVKLRAEGLCNGKIIKADEKTVALKTEDFNQVSECMIKYQPKLQECKGFKLFIESDFEIAELKIGTTPGAMNQTTKRI